MTGKNIKSIPHHYNRHNNNFNISKLPPILLNSRCHTMPTQIPDSGILTAAASNNSQPIGRIPKLRISTSHHQQQQTIEEKGKAK
jgi:hypothetical protein